MARPLRICYEGAVYHITLRGNERKAIFADNHDRERFLLKLGESLQRYDVRLYLYCLMMNHCHLVLETPRGNLSAFMQRFQTAYTLYFNRRHNRHGHLLQGRFGASVVDEEEYILKLSRYVHLNPVYVRGVKRLPVDERIALLRSYSWSSYRSYIGTVKPLGFVDEKPILAMMGPTQRQQRSTYRRFVEGGVSEIDAAFIEAKSKSCLGIGSEAFRERIVGMYDSLLNGNQVQQDISFRRIARHCGVEEVLSVVCEVLGVEREQLLRRQRASMDRPLAAHALCQYCGLTQRQVAGVLTLRSGAAVSHQIKRLVEAVQQDKSLQRKQARIASEIESRTH